ncbi:MAG TPA: ABC transporter ATP-binding protein [Hyphomicrobiaceae bacterium]|nr:ABC transporter ATP-binding protein [Hyphomicrobiaceae bacterium]
MTHAAIRIQGLSKQYVLPSGAERHDTLRSAVMARASRMFRPEPVAAEPFWALRDISFDVNAGDVIGIIGRNGAGKSTLLKLLSRVTAPTSGRVDIYGRVGSLLEVGTGFDRELTGRENVYLNGAILGMRKREIDRKFDEIVAFAEVEQFIDTPVKRYSSGMYLRLAFAVAAHLEPEILILDEVLAVGDARFQARCLGKMGEVAAAGRTVLFVSHNMAAIARFCPRCVWLEQGRLREFGPTEEIVGRYLTLDAANEAQVSFPEDAAPGSEYVKLLAVRLENGRGVPTASIGSSEPVVIELEYRTLRDTNGLRLGVTLITRDGSVLLSSKDLDVLPENLHRPPGRYVSRCELPANFLNSGQYFVSVGADFPMIQGHFHLDRVVSFLVEPAGGGGSHIPDGRAGFLRMSLPWTQQRLD